MYFVCILKKHRCLKSLTNYSWNLSRRFFFIFKKDIIFLLSESYRFDCAKILKGSTRNLSSTEVADNGVLRPSSMLSLLFFKLIIFIIRIKIFDNLVC